MTSIRILWLLLCLLWIGAEIRLARKSRVSSNRISDREELSQRVLWLTVITGLLSAFIFKSVAWAPIPIDYLLRQAIALVLFTSGLILRYIAVSALGSFFTTDVSIRHEHELIRTGPYRWIRHPAYTGLLIALGAVGLAMGDWIALGLLTAPIFYAISFRIGIEEYLLEGKFGAIYRDYTKTTWKLLPWLY